MSLVEELTERVEPLIDTIYHEDFIQGVIHGNLPKESVRRYLRQDSKYLAVFADLYALLLSKAKSLKVKKQLYQMLDFVLNERNGAHQVLADYLGEDYEGVIADDEWYPSADHYVKHMYYNAYRYSNPVFGLSAMAPCPYVYVRLAHLIYEREEIADDNGLKGWIDFYNAPADAADDNLFINALNEAEATLSYKEIEIIKKNFYQSAEHERAFFNMATGVERWGFERGDY